MLFKESYSRNSYYRYNPISGVRNQIKGVHTIFPPLCHLALRVVSCDFGLGTYVPRLSIDSIGWLRAVLARPCRHARALGNVPRRGLQALN